MYRRNRQATAGRSRGHKGKGQTVVSIPDKRRTDKHGEGQVQIAPFECRAGVTGWWMSVISGSALYHDGDAAPPFRGASLRATAAATGKWIKAIGYHQDQAVANTQSHPEIW